MKIIKHFKQLFIFSFLLITYIGCGSIKPTTSTGKIKKYIEEFYIGDGVMQYFIQPISYTDINQQKASLDATIRNIDQTKDSITINFTVALKTKLDINKVVLDNKQKTVTINRIKTLFREKGDELFTHRASIKIPYLVYTDILLSEKHTIDVYNPSEKTTIYPENKGIKTINILKQKLPNKILN